MPSLSARTNSQVLGRYRKLASLPSAVPRIAKCRRSRRNGPATLGSMLTDPIGGADLIQVTRRSPQIGSTPSYDLPQKKGPEHCPAPTKAALSCLRSGRGNPL